MIDVTNILEFFETSVSPEPGLNQGSGMLERVYFGRIFAAQWLFRIPALRTHKKLWETLKNLSEIYRGFISSKLNAEILERELREVRDKVASLEAHLQDQIGKAAFTYTAVENPTVKPDLVFAGGEEYTQEMRATLHNNAKL